MQTSPIWGHRAINRVFTHEPQCRRLSAEFRQSEFQPHAGGRYERLFAVCSRMCDEETNPTNLFVTWGWTGSVKIVRITVELQKLAGIP